MPRPTFDESQRMRELIQKAVDAGMSTPSDVYRWLVLHKADAPTIATISRIMQEEMGFVRTPTEWKKGK
jgi:DNA-binding phage protein